MVTKMELLKSESRYTLHPIKHPDIFDFYEKQIRSFWTVQEISFSDDRADWEKLNEEN